MIPESERVQMTSVSLEEIVSALYDVAIIVTNHSCMDYEKLLIVSNALLDTRNGLADAEPKVRHRIWRL